jgi:hypothetical protein
VEIPAVEELRRLAAREGVRPSDEDLEAVRAFLGVLLPQLVELERTLEADDVPAGMMLP